MARKVLHEMDRPILSFSEKELEEFRFRAFMLPAVMGVCKTFEDENDAIREYIAKREDGSDLALRFHRCYGKVRPYPGVMCSRCKRKKVVHPDFNPIEHIAELEAK